MSIIANPTDGSVPAPLTTTPRLTGGVPLRDVLSVPALAGYRIAAGARGLDRMVRRMNVMEVPDILPWVKPNEFLLTTAYPFREQPEQLSSLVPALADRELSGLGVKLGRYLDRLPPDLVAHADRLDFPVVELASHVRYDDVLQQTLTRILDHQVSALSVSERVHHTLAEIVLSGGSLPEVAHDVARVLRRAVLIAEPGGAVIGSAGFTDPDRLEHVRRAIVGLRPGDRRSERITALQGGMRLLTVPISADVRYEGVIGAVELDRPLGDDDLAALRSAALVAALVLHQQSAVRSARHKSAADLLHALIGGRFEHAHDVVRRAAAMGWDLTRRLLVMIVDGDRPPHGGGHSQQRLLSAVTSAVRRRDSSAAIVPLATEIVIITSADTAADEVSDAVAGSGARSLVGVSRVIDGPAQIAAAYEQAATAVRIGRRIHRSDAAVLFDDLGSYRILSLVPPDELRAYAVDTLGPLLADSDDATVLRDTLHTFLETGGNVAATARRLHFHYNTVRGRLARIESLIGVFTTDPRRQIDLALALQITTMHELGFARGT
ncbi:MAG: PucR family transcriptional regulator ligand-binding domain-containing protein [Actinobacteria bacterium]|nr:PucR family transcriptional regulator ligand-binding domain-containing protein [Actinomycetota bacterium]